MNIIKNMDVDIPDDIGRDFLKKLMDGRLNPYLEKMLEENRKECIKALKPAALYEIFTIDRIVNNSVYFKSGNIFNGPNISRILKGSEIAVIFMLTLGKEVDDLIKKVREGGDTLGTIIMDSITTEMLHVAGDQAGRIIKKNITVPDDYASTCPYSPGQYKWTIEEQKELFNMVDGSKIGISLNQSYLMIPFKSISGVYGFGPKDKIDKTRVACDLCPRRDTCIGRR
jgi:hypothetical protein